MNKYSLLLLFHLIALGVVAQRPDSVQVNGQWYFVYPLDEKVEPSSAILDKMDLSRRQFDLFREWKLANDSRINLPKRTLIDSLNRELLRSKITVTEDQNKYEWRKATRPVKRVRPLMMRKKHWYRNHPELVTKQLIDLNYDLLPAIQNLPNGKYIQYFEPVLSYHELKNTTILPTRIAAMFELKNNLPESEFTRFNYKGDTIRHGFFTDGLKEGQWTVSNKQTSLRYGIIGLKEANTIYDYGSSIRVELQKGILHGAFYKWDAFDRYQLVGFFKNGYADSIWKTNIPYSWDDDQILDYNSVLDTNYNQQLKVVITPSIWLDKKYEGFDFKEKKKDYHSLTLYECQEDMYEQGVPALPLVDFADLFDKPMRSGLTHLKTVDQNGVEQRNHYRNTGHVNFHGTKQVFDGNDLTERYTYLPDLGAIVYARFFSNGNVFDTLGYEPQNKLFVHNVYDANGKLFRTTTYNTEGGQVQQIDYYKQKKTTRVREEKPVVIEGFTATREKYEISWRYNKYAVWHGGQTIDGKRYEKIVWNAKTKKRTYESYTNIADSAEHSIFYNRKGKPAFDETLLKTGIDSIWRRPVYDTLYTVMHGGLKWEQKLANDTKEPAVLRCFDVPYSGPLSIRFSGDRLQLDDQIADGLKWTVPTDLYSGTLENEFSENSIETQYSFRFSKRDSRSWDYRDYSNPFTDMMLELFRGQIGFYAIARMEGEFQNGHPAGNWNYYNKKGELIFTLNFVRGLPDGDIVEFAQYEGPSRRDKKYHDDEPYFDFLFSKDAPKLYREQTYHYTDGKLNGSVITYTAMGDTMGVIDYKMGEIHGKIWRRHYDNVYSHEYQNDELHGFSLEGKLKYNYRNEMVMDTIHYAHYENGLLHGDCYLKFYENDYQDYGNEERIVTSYNRYEQMLKTVRCQFQQGQFHGKYVQRIGNDEVEFIAALTNGFLDTLTFFENGAVSYYYDYAEEQRLAPYRLSDTASLGLKSRYFYSNRPDLEFERGLIIANEYNGRMGNSYSQNSHNIEEFKQGRFTKLYPNGNLARRGYRIGYKNFGDWDFYNYNGQRLYSIDYGTQTVTMHGVTYTPDEVKGEYIEYDSLGMPLCRGFVIEELEKYDCAHSDYYAIRQYVIIEDSDDSVERTNGPMRYYFDNGMLMSEGTIKEGMPEGVWKFYTPDGKLTRIGKYVNGKKEGRWLKGDLGDKKYIGEICLNPDDPLLDFHIAELERMRDVEIVIYRNGTAQIQQQYEVAD